MSTPPVNRKSSSDLIWLILGLALGALGWFAYQYWQTPAESGAPTVTYGTWLPEPQSIPEVSLLDHHGQPFTPTRLQGHWTFMFFGYTHCPDVCPTTMTVLAGMQRQLQELNVTLPQVVFVSVDPERDTVEQLSRFVPYFNPDFIGVTGAEDQISRLTRSLGILHARVNLEQSGSGYLVDHSAAVLLFNPQGRYTALFSAPHVPANLTEDYLRILQYDEAH